jgi:hypothetical protein
VVWKAGEVPLDGGFAAETAYTATVTLSAKSGYNFKGVPATPATGSFFHSRSAGVSHPAGTDSALAITVLFGITGSDSGTEVTDYNLQPYVPVPVAGQAPVKELEKPSLTLSVEWQDKNDVPLPDLDIFTQGVQYKAVITLTAIDPWKFSSGYPFYYPAGSVQSQDDLTKNGRYERFVFVTYNTTDKPTEVTDLDLTHHIPAPATGATAAWSVLGVGNQYTGNVRWEVSGGAGWTAMPPGVFQPGMAYRAVVTLYPGPGCVFAEDAAVSHDARDKAEPFEPEIKANTINVTISFPATILEPVTDGNLTPYVPAPFRGGTPVTYFSAPQYTGTVDWIVIDSGGSGSSHNGPFEADTEYAARVSLSAALGYIFTGDWTPTHSNGSLAPVDSYITVVDIAFPKTGSVPAVTVDKLDLASYVPAPALGGIPTTYFLAPQYTGAVKWTVTSSPGAGPHSGLFGADKAYTATVTLTAASGYTFTGVGANVFTHDGGDAISNAENSGVVTIAFPATDAPVTDLDLTSYLDAPVVDQTPQTVIPASAPQYEGGVAWTRRKDDGAEEPHTGAFETDVIYTATVTLSAKQGYTFAVGTTFVYDGKTRNPTDNTGGSIRVRIDGLEASSIPIPW